MKHYLVKVMIEGITHNDIPFRANSEIGAMAIADEYYSKRYEPGKYKVKSAKLDTTKKVKW